MTSLNYFLDKKSLNKLLKDLESKIWEANIPISINNKLRFNLIKQIEADSYITDYMNAYKVNNQYAPLQIINNLDITSLLLIDGDLTNKTPEYVYNAIVEIRRGRKAMNTDEKIIWNVVEAYNLIQKEQFEINEDNFELFVHIIFRNIGLDLDNKNSYYRQDNDKTLIKSVFPFDLIDEELLGLIDYIKSLKKTKLGGFTQSYLIFIQVLLISPYRKYNFIVATLLSQWYLYQSNLNYKMMHPIYKITNNWKEFIGLLDEVSSKDFTIDSILEFIRRALKEEVNISYRNLLIEKWLKNNKCKNLFKNDFQKIILALVVNYPKVEISLQQIRHEFSFAGEFCISKKEMEEHLQTLVDNKILITKPGQTVKYQLLEKELIKIKLLLAQ
ncbi:hypothetical protein [Mesoplasma photuris]|uniref:hypothetical protein n=1 Tax=Mesoplasma photuris TaxID=217731 RepID=UPI0004E173F3|nr:hypothetical protein [Mesoplasma photuris]